MTGEILGHTEEPTLLLCWTTVLRNCILHIYVYSHCGNFKKWHARERHHVTELG